MPYVPKNRIRKKLRPENKYLAAPQKRLWRVIEGAVVDCFKMHPDYLTPKGARHGTAVRSIVKRVIAQVIDKSELVERSASGRSGDVRGS